MPSELQLRDSFEILCKISGNFNLSSPYCKHSLLKFLKLFYQANKVIQSPIKQEYWCQSCMRKETGGDRASYFWEISLRVRSKKYSRKVQFQEGL
jgi:hypothetical protein